MLKAIDAQESLEAAREKADRIIEQLRAMCLRKAAEWVEQHIDETLSYYRYPLTHWTQGRFWLRTSRRQRPLGPVVQSLTRPGLQPPQL